MASRQRDVQHEAGGSRQQNQHGVQMADTGTPKGHARIRTAASGAPMSQSTALKQEAARVGQGRAGGRCLGYRPAWLCAGAAQGSERGTRQGLGLQKEAAL